MRKNCVLVLFLFAAAAATSTSSAREVLDAGQRRQAEQIVEALSKRFGVPGVSIAMGRNNRLAYACAYGEADVENRVPATVDSVFRTASIAKMITATAVMQLVEQGQLELDKPVEQYLPEVQGKRWSFNTAQLLSHLAGIRHYRDSREEASTKHFTNVRSALSEFISDPLVHEPGTEYLYSTFGFNLLGALVEERSNQLFDSYVQKNIFDVANMSHTQRDNHFAIIPHRSRGYVRRPTRDSGSSRSINGNLDSHATLCNAVLHDTSVKVPGGGMVSTPTDLIRFANALNRGELLNEDTTKQMWSEQMTVHGGGTDYGLGFRIFVGGDKNIVGHSGGQAGVTTYLMLRPSTGASAAIMCNLEDTELRDACRELLVIAEASRPKPIASSLKTRPKSGERSEVLRPVFEKLAKFVENERHSKDLSAVSVAIVDRQRTIWSAGWGYEDEKETRPSSGDTLFRVGSVSKLFTDMAAVQLAEEGKLDLDADVRTYLPDFTPKNPYGKPITLRLLMTHRSGLVREPPVGNYFDPTEPTLAATVASLNQTELVYEPGAHTKYSNAAIAVVGRVIEVVTEQSFEEYLNDRLLAPLGMDRSTFRRSDQVDERLASAWMRTPHTPAFEAPMFALGTAPAGNLYASANDIGRFLSMVLGEGALAGERIVDANTIRKMLQTTESDSSDKYSYGLGFRIAQRNGRTTAGHGGAVYGYSTQVDILPEDDLAVVAISAVDCSNGITRRICDYATDLIVAHRAGKPLPDISNGSSLRPGQAQSLEGQYKNGSDIIDLFEFNNRLFMRKGAQLREILAVSDEQGVSQLTVDDLTGFGPVVRAGGDSSLAIGETKWTRTDETLPLPCPEQLREYLGEYGWDHNTLYIYEDRGQLWALIEWVFYYPLTEIEQNVFAFPVGEGLYDGERLYFQRNDEGEVVHVDAANVRFERRPVGRASSKVFRISPTRPVEVLRRDAMVASPPEEPGDFRKPDLVELRVLEPGIKYDIRYASDRNFMRTPFYKTAHAFMQRPAAEAVALAHRKLADQGYGLLVHDAYRPWSVTKMFWDGTPEHLRHFVANPDEGSRHNRGCAVDLTLYDLETGAPIEMVAGYDEFTQRSYPLYPGGTSRQRWCRRLLRNAMEQAGFSIYEFEWWHFDYKFWTQYPIGNTSFDDILP